MEQRPQAILRRPQVIARTGLKRTAIQDRINAGDFPRPVSLGARAVGWLESEVDAWIASRAAQRESARGAQ